MALARIWLSLFGLGFLAACYKAFVRGQIEVFSALGSALLDSAKTSVEISIGLVGIMAFWLGIMRVGEAAGLIEKLARFLSPVLGRLFPGIPAGHPALGAMVMNLSANMLGLDSAATPLGLKAMQSLQELNPDPDRATNAQLMFTILNSAGITLIPVSVMVYRAQLGAANPADVFLPALLGTVISALSGIVITASLQRINLFHPKLFFPLLAVLIGIGLLVWQAATLNETTLGHISLFAGNFLMVGVILLFLTAGALRKVNVYDAFIEGAKGGFETGVRIIPYLVAMLAAIAAIRSTGVMDYALAGISRLIAALGLDTAFVPALPTALMKPLSGSGARGLMIDTMKTYGADSFVGKLVSTVQGSTETTFYVLALYYGSVGVRHTRYSLTVGLIVDAIGVLAAIFLGYLFFAD